MVIITIDTIIDLHIILGFTARCNSFTLSDISYVGMIYYERDDLVIFTAAKKLDALLKVFIYIQMTIHCGST